MSIAFRLEVHTEPTLTFWVVKLDTGLNVKHQEDLVTTRNLPSELVYFAKTNRANYLPEIGDSRRAPDFHN